MVLVVDDEDSIRQIARSTLEAFGYQVLTAADGTEALALVDSRHQSSILRWGEYPQRSLSVWRPQPVGDYLLRPL